jgi:hypothetical protein
MKSTIYLSKKYHSLVYQTKEAWFPLPYKPSEKLTVNKVFPNEHKIYIEDE